MATTTTTPTEVDPDLTTEEERRRIQRQKNQSAIDLLESWANATEEEVEEQKETLAFLKKALDDDRPSYRKLFP